MIATQNFYFRSEVLNNQAAYDKLAEILPTLATVHPNFGKWWFNPRSPKDAAIPFTDKAAALSRLEETKRKIDDEFPGTTDDRFTDILLTNADNDRQWRDRGRVSLNYTPAEGVLQLDISNNAGSYKDFGGLLWSFLIVMSNAKELQFANCNVMHKVEELLLYSNDRAPFSHRQFLGWMGYIPQLLTQEQVPAAYKLQPHGSGTLVRSTEVLDLGNPHAVKQANQVEMSLADLDLLEIIDPGLKPE